jgi:anti-anti-sigma factor
MPIAVRCPNGHMLHVKTKHAGKIGICPHCSAPVVVPQVGETYASIPPGSSGIIRTPSEEYVHQEPRHDRVGDLSDSMLSSSSSILAGKGKLCLACGRIASRSFSKCPQCGTSLDPYRTLIARKEGEAIALLLTTPQILDDASVKVTIDELCNAVDRAENRNIVLDFSKIRSLSSLMLGKLVMLQGKLRQKKRLLALWNVRPEVRDVLAATKLDQVLHVRENQ